MTLLTLCEARPRRSRQSPDLAHLDPTILEPDPCISSSE